MLLKVNSREEVEVRFTLNGDMVSGRATSRLLLSDFLRDVLGNTGTHVGCEHGVCGACTIRVEGRAVRSCLTFAVQVDGKKVDTVEGLDEGGGLAVLQEKFIEHSSVQCGFCTPGILMSLAELLDQGKPVGEEGIRELLSGHLCRCTGYTTIVKAAVAAVSEVQSAGSFERDA